MIGLCMCWLFWKWYEEEGLFIHPYIKEIEIITSHWNKKVEKFVNIIAVYMIFNFRIYGINQNTYKLIQIFILIQKQRKLPERKANAIVQSYCT